MGVADLAGIMAATAATTHLGETITVFPLSGDSITIQALVYPEGTDTPEAGMAMMNVGAQILIPQAAWSQKSEKDPQSGWRIQAENGKQWQSRSVSPADGGFWRIELVALTRS